MNTKANLHHLRWAAIGLATSLLGGCGGTMPIHATFDSLTNETLMRPSEYFNYTSLVSASGMAPPHSASLMYHQPEFYDRKPGSPSYGVGVSPWQSFVVEMKLPMKPMEAESGNPEKPADAKKGGDSPPEKIQDAKNQAEKKDIKTMPTDATKPEEVKKEPGSPPEKGQDSKSQAEKKDSQPMPTDATAAAVNSSDTTKESKYDTNAQVVRVLRDKLERIRDLTSELVTARVEKEFADKLLADVKVENKDSANLAKTLTEAIGTDSSLSKVGDNLSKLPEDKKSKLKAELNAFKGKYITSAKDKTSVISEDTLTKIDKLYSTLDKGGDTKATQEKSGDAQATQEKEGDAQTAVALKKTLGQTTVSGDAQILMAKALLGEHAVVGNKIDYGDLAVKKSSSTSEAKKLEEKIRKQTEALRNMARYSNVVLTRWAREKERSLTGDLLPIVSAQKQSYQADSGVLVMGDLRITTLFTGEDIVDLVRYSKGRYLEFLNHIGITTYAIQAKHLAYSSDRDLTSVVAANLKVSVKELEEFTSTIEDQELKAGVVSGLGLDLGNSAVISESTTKTTSHPFFPPSALERSIREEITASSGYKTVFAVRAKPNTPFIENALRMKSDRYDQALASCDKDGLSSCEQGKCAAERIVDEVAKQSWEEQWQACNNPQEKSSDHWQKCLSARFADELRKGCSATGKCKPRQ